MAESEWLISGSGMHFIKRVMLNDCIEKLRYTFKEIHEKTVAMGNDAIYAFQVRNLLQNGHCLLLADTRVQLIKQVYKNPFFSSIPRWVSSETFTKRMRLIVGNLRT